MRIISGILAAALTLFPVGTAAAVENPTTPASGVATTPVYPDGWTPAVIPREVWGAREPSCEWAGTDGDRVTHAVIHHTYEPTGEPSIESAYEALQHIQNLHMDDNGWCDIGYSYLVDWFGNVYEGARGTIERPITSAHTSGLNFEGAGIALIGRYQEIPPTDMAVEAAGQIAGWVLGWYGYEAGQDVTLTVGGANNKFASGARITVPAITAHRDVVNTECPGDAAYARLPEIRTVAENVTHTMQTYGSFGRGTAGERPIFATGSPIDPTIPQYGGGPAGGPMGEPAGEPAGEPIAGGDPASEPPDPAAEDNPATAGDNGVIGDGANLVVEPSPEVEAAEGLTLDLWWIAALVAAAAALLWWWLRRRNKLNE